METGLPVSLKRPAAAGYDVAVMSQRTLRISVIGGSVVPPSIETVAEEVGRELARHGATLICGGLGGVMEAACRGAAAEGGRTVGILPGTDPREANRYVELPIPTGMGWARNVMVALAGQAVIAIDGGYGTLSELAYALQAGIPIVTLRTWRMTDHRGVLETKFIEAETAAEAVAKAVAAARGETVVP